MSAPRKRPGPSPALRGAAAYRTERPERHVDLRLDGNEGVPPPAALLEVLRASFPEIVRRYPDAAPLEKTIAARLGIAPERVLVTAGADEGLDRACRALVGPGDAIVLPSPTFEMLPRYARLAGARVVEVPWAEGPYPAEGAIAAAASSSARAIAVVSPNNPTGAVATEDDLLRLSAGAPEAFLLVDLAYAEFADVDLTPAALALDNALVFRTLSKAWGLAGLRVGYVAARDAEIVSWLRAAAGPYPVAGPSLALAAARLESGEAEVRRFVATVREERRTIAETLERLGAEPLPSQANFVFARFRDAGYVRDALAGLGIAVRAFKGRDGLEDALRITCPGGAAPLERLLGGLAAALAPEAVLLDVDGVLADDSKSYRLSVVETARTFGVAVTSGEIAAMKAKGDANDDWALTRRLLAEKGVDATLAEVTARFEAIYQGANGLRGLRETETLIPARATLERLARRFPLAAVTGRPRADALRFLEEKGVAPLFRAVVAREDGPMKPDPSTVRAALARVGAKRAVMVGDTPDDVRAARAAGVVPLGVVAPGDAPSAAEEVLLGAGAARVLSSLDELEALLP